MLLIDMSKGERGKVRSLNSRGLSITHWQQLMALGLTPGAVIEMVRKAPLGGAFQLRLRGTRLCIDSRLAQQIEMETI